MTPDELWEKYAADEFIDGWKRFVVDSRIDRDNFFAALQEYGESVRQQAVRVCRETGGYADECAAAIEKMEIK